MKQEEKTLLLRDLCARLPYGVVLELDEKFGFNKGTHILVKELLDSYCVEGIKPYLRPMYSMTEEEKNYYLNTFKKSIIGTDEEDGRIWTVDSIDWLNAHHFDYRNLIGKGLAIEAPEGMYNIKEK